MVTQVLGDSLCYPLWLLFKIVHAFFASSISEQETLERDENSSDFKTVGNCGFGDLSNPDSLQP